jgi:hypothetical protein
MTLFDDARRSALIQDLLAHFRKRPADLLPFDEVRERLHLKRVADRGVQEVPVDRIVGTVQRERDFNRAFLPRDEALRDRWQKIEGMAVGPKGMSPVELYKVSDAYFVVDGHHRVSVARSLNVPTIEAQVKEFATPVPLPTDASIEDVILREGLAGFLETTGLAPSRADEYRVTEPGGYERLLDHISVHRYFRGIDLHRPFGRDEAVASWRDLVYRPMIETIRKSAVMKEFPGRTETDLYLFVMDHLAKLRQQYGPSLPFSRAVRHFMLSLEPRGGDGIAGRLARWWKHLHL